jgi:hypothetical protein
MLKKGAHPKTMKDKTESSAQKQPQKHHENSITEKGTTIFDLLRKKCMESFCSA